jgi:SAM-dependent methyltransferase
MSTVWTAGWARKAARLYDADYAKRYRAHDDQLLESPACLGFVDWLQRTCRQFQPPIDVLDLGCGTGRYFWALEGVRTLVGIDASASMLEEAAHPFRADQIRAGKIELIHGDLFDHDFGASRFHLVYSIGVLGEHSPLDQVVVARVRHWLNSGGRFAFTTVHPDSFSIQRTWRRQLGRAAEKMLPPPFKSPMHERLLSHGRYADEGYIRKLLEPAFVIESVERFVSEAHLHCLCVARKGARGPREHSESSSLAARASGGGAP